MPHPYKCYKGKDLSSLAVWFLVTYLYSILIDDKETRYKKRTNYNRSCRKILLLLIRDLGTIKIWINFILTSVAKETKNNGDVSFTDQKRYAKEIKKLLKL